MPLTTESVAHDWQTIGEVYDCARESLTPEVWDMISGGSGREATLRRNVASLDRLGLVPRVLTGASSCDPSIDFLGQRLTAPILLAPIGEIARFAADGALACAQVAGQMETAAFISAVSSPALEVVRTGSASPLVFQIYAFGDGDWLDRLVQRAENAGYDAICLTVDTPVGGRPDRVLRRRLELPPPPDRPNIEGGARAPYTGASLTWADVTRLREGTRLPLILKGILHPDDARRAVEHGVDAVCVSNHGGLQLDDAIATVEALPEIVAAVDGAAVVLVDGGFTRGSDVIKALALGARGVLIGRLMVLALAAGGASGLRRTLEILNSEIVVGLLNLGVRSVTELRPEHVRETNASGYAEGER